MGRQTDEEKKENDVPNVHITTYLHTNVYVLFMLSQDPDL